jgi:3-carboxy-cis,cis-muconate cycloisomerase
VIDPPAHPGTIFSLLHRTFGDASMEAIFSESQTIDSWLQAEAALAQSQAAVGDLTPSQADAISAACTLANVDIDDLWRETGNVGYPILPLIRQVTAALLPEASGWMHYGATTQDIMDTGLAIQLAAAIDRLDTLARDLGDALAATTEAHADTVMAGRTHGQQAVPITLGAKLATFLWQCLRLRHDLEAVRADVCRISMHGAAGTSAGYGPHIAEVRAGSAERLGLLVGDGPWHVRRDGIAAFGAVCARAAAICARLAREVIDLARTEIAEVTESTGHHRGASSTMPQKVNPIDSEAIVGMAATVTALSSSLYRAMEAGHERSAGEWQIEWHVVPQVAVLTAGSLRIAARVVAGLSVDQQRMVSNLGLEQGRTLSEAYMFELAPELGREVAHDAVYAAAVASRERGIGLREALLEVSGIDADDLAVLGPADYVGQAEAEARSSVAAWRAQRGAE